MSDKRIVECPDCEGSGYEEHTTYRNDEYGNEIFRRCICRHCEGTGDKEITVEPITMEDL